MDSIIILVLIISLTVVIATSLQNPPNEVNDEKQEDESDSYI